MVGTSGSARDRVLVETASARSFPSLTSGTAGAVDPKEIGVWPATAEAIARPPPLDGTWMRSRPSDRRYKAPNRDGGGLRPGRAWASFPGLGSVQATL